MSETTTICRQCERPRNEHWSVSFCNGVQQSGEVLVCPTAIFQEPEGIDDENLRTWNNEEEERERRKGWRPAKARGSR